MKAAAAVPHLQWTMAEGCFASSGPDYEAFVTTRYDGQWVAIVIGSRGRESYLGGPWVARHAAQMWAERSLAAGGIPADAIDIKAEAAKAPAARNPAITCPAWCEDDHQGDNPASFLHLSGMREVACAVTKESDGHYCGRTRSLLAPEYNEPACHDPVFAQIVADESGVTTIEVGHGDDLLPNLTPEAALELAARITELARLAGAS